jgi:hypothetical protein
MLRERAGTAREPTARAMAEAVQASARPNHHARAQHHAQQALGGRKQQQACGVKHAAGQHDRTKPQPDR